MYKKNIYFLLLILLSASAAAQPCISAFPFRETFEANNGGWAAGGVASDWAWGSPTKPTITAAGEGTKCWISGGLTGSFYNNGENSWVQSPCFNFTTLVHPRLSFKLFWETELGFDGADFQYSIDGGTTWLNLGTINSNSNCLGVNWYNSGSIRYLGNKAGWAGNIQTTGCNTAGGGSGGWLTASHDLGALAGLPNVIFRFEFGAGTQCNSFDGFAFDDFNIFESTPNTASFSFTCKPAHSVDFTSQSVCSTSSAWNFGDAASGANNTSSSNTPTHIFSAAGTYTVALTSTFASGPPSTTSQQIIVLDVNVNLDHPVSCSTGSDAVLTATATGSSGYNYVWNTNPPQNGPSITTGAGNYTVTVTAGTSCPATTSIVVTDPAPLTASPVITQQKCSTLNGAIVSNISGGTGPYNYLWSNTAVSPDISGLAAGDYTLLVTDANSCIFNSGTITVPHDNGGLTVNLPATVGLCPNQTLILNPGIFSSYLWQDNSTSPTYTVTATGLYSVTVTDANGCTAGASTNVVTGCTELYFPSAFTPNGDTKNEMFGPAGNNFFAITDYQLNVYDRYGELAFRSTDPYKKWDGTFKGKMSGNTTFVWMVSYRVSGRVGFQKGTVTLIR